MATRKLLLLPGDGIGPEAMDEVRKIIAFMNDHLSAGFEIEEGLVGGSAYDSHGQSISEDHMDPRHGLPTLVRCSAPSAGRNGTAFPTDVRPEAGLLRLRKDHGAVSPICGRRSAIRHSLPPRRCVRNWSRASTS